MIGMAINIMWMLLGLVVLCAVIWFVLYIVQSVLEIAIPLASSR